MEHSDVLHLLLKLHKDAILQVLRLKVRFAVDWTVEEAGEAQVPHQVLDILSTEEVLVEIVSEIVHQGLELIELVSSHLLIVQLGYRPMKQAKVLVELHEGLVENLGVLFLEDGGLELVVGDGLGFLVLGLALAVDGVWVLQDHVEPDVGFDLLYEVRV